MMAVAMTTDHHGRGIAADHVLAIIPPDV